jgi:hypothetical protein
MFLYLATRRRFWSIGNRAAALAAHAEAAAAESAEADRRFLAFLADPRTPRDWFVSSGGRGAALAAHADAAAAESAEANRRFLADPRTDSAPWQAGR